MVAIAYVVIGAIVSSDANVRDLGVCWNDSIQRIFGFKRYESVKQLQFFLCYHFTCCIRKYLNGAELLSDALSVLFKFQVHVMICL